MRGFNSLSLCLTGLAATHQSDSLASSGSRCCFVGLRELIGSAAIDEVLEKRGEFSKRLMELKAPKIAELGVTLLSVEIKDIMFPGDLKKIFAQVVKARKEGLAALEKARAETVTLRHLANAAQLIERHPNLMQLRALQSVGGSSGNTLVLGMPPQTMPLPINASETDKLENLPAGEAKE